MSESGRTIYLVDDDDSIRRSGSFMLRTSGFLVKTYASGIEFLKDIKELEPGCILLDVRMPGMDGLEVQKELRGRGIAFPVIVMTGHGDVGVAVQAMKAGAVDFIEKPVEKPVLLDAVRECFHRIEQSHHAEARMAEAQVRLEALSEREKEVLDGLARGFPNKTIAYDLGISPRTVEIHRANLMSKLEVRSLSEALRVAFAAGMGREATKPLS
jgi:two-component system, LuxR family, response regulator FixJ